jgi:hypothetical protein
VACSQALAAYAREVVGVDSSKVQSSLLPPCSCWRSQDEVARARAKFPQLEFHIMEAGEHPHPPSQAMSLPCALEGTDVKQLGQLRPRFTKAPWHAPS